MVLAKHLLLVNTFYIELICLLVTSSSSVNGLCYERFGNSEKITLHYNLAELLGVIIMI